MRYSFSLLLLIVFLGLLNSCGSTDSTTSAPPFVNPGGVPTTINTMTATIDGKDFKSVFCVGLKVFIDDTITSIIISGADLTRGLGLGITGHKTTGTYPVGSMDTSGGAIRFITMNYNEIKASIHDTLFYQTPFASPDDPPVGSLTIVELTQTSLKATFNATLTKSQGISGASTITITNGGVNVQLD